MAGKEDETVDTIIQAILNIEERAREIVKEAQEQKAAYDENLSDECDRLRKEMIEKCRADLDVQRQSYISESGKKAEENYKKAETKAEEFEQHTMEFRAQWIDELYRRITGVSDG